MRRANILIRAAVGPGGDFGPLVRAAAVEGWLRRLWPEARVTVFGEGPPAAHDWLYTRVHDLVPICSLTPGTDEGWARETRGPADLVLWDGPTFTEERRRIWQPARGHLVVRCETHRNLWDDRPLAGWHHAPSDFAATPEALLGFEWALLDPALSAAACDRLPPAAPARTLAVVLGPASDTKSELELISEAASASKLFDRVTIVIPASSPRQHRAALKAAWPEAAIETSPDLVVSTLAAADLALLAGPAHAPEALALGTPTVLVSMSRDDESAGRLLSGSGVVQDLGVLQDLATGTILRSLQELSQDVGTLRALSFRASALIDGKGFQRLFQLLLPDSPPARLSDSHPARRSMLLPVGTP